MNVKLNSLRLGIFLLIASGWSSWSQGFATVWDGSFITFNHPDGADSGVRDQLSPGVALTRGNSQGLFNAVTEAAYTHSFSPQDTAWAYGSLENYASLTYTTWETLYGGRGNLAFDIVGQPAVVHLVSENIYLALTFTSWAGPGGAFSYDRSTPSAVPEPSICGLSGWSGLLALAVIARRKRLLAA